MNSLALPSFWECYKQLDQPTRKAARKAFRLWSANPFYPSLRFKCINRDEGLWAVRITLGIRAIGIMQSETVTWFWIGSHEEYERFFS